MSGLDLRETSFQRESRFSSFTNNPTSRFDSVSRFDSISRFDSNSRFESFSGHHSGHPSSLEFTGPKHLRDSTSTGMSTALSTAVATITPLDYSDDEKEDVPPKTLASLRESERENAPPSSSGGEFASESDTSSKELVKIKEEGDIEETATSSSAAQSNENKNENA